MNDDIRNREYLGQGLAFPLQYDPRGGIAMARGERDVEQAIRIILETAPGERVMRPEFGCRIHDLIFAPYDATTQGLMIRFVEQALERWEPRITVREVNLSIRNLSYDFSGKNDADLRMTGPTLGATFRW